MRRTVSYATDSKGHTIGISSGTESSRYTVSGSSITLIQAKDTSSRGSMSGSKGGSATNSAALSASNSGSGQVPSGQISSSPVSIPSGQLSSSSVFIPTSRVTFSSGFLRSSTQLPSSGVSRTLPSGDVSITVTGSGSTIVVTVAPTASTGTVKSAGPLPSGDCERSPIGIGCPGAPPRTTDAGLSTPLDCVRTPTLFRCPYHTATASLDCVRTPTLFGCSRPTATSLDCVRTPTLFGCPRKTDTDVDPPTWLDCEHTPTHFVCPHPTATAAAEHHDDNDVDLWGLFGLLAVPAALGLKSCLKRAKIAKKFAKLRFVWPKKPKFGIHVPHLKLPKGNLPSLRIPIPGRSIRKPKIKLPGRLHCGRNSASSSMVCVTSEAIEKLAPLGEAGALSRQARLCRVSPPVPPRDKIS
jgi:hypothetical protein